MWYLCQRMMWAYSAADASMAQTAREQFINALKLNASPGADYGACELIFGEIVGNVVRHAPGRISIVLNWAGDRAVLCVEDSGAMFQFDPSLPLDLLSETGRGLYLVSALGGRIDLAPMPHGKAVRVALPVARPGA